MQTAQTTVTVTARVIDEVSSAALVATTTATTTDPGLIKSIWIFITSLFGL